MDDQKTHKKMKSKTEEFSKLLRSNSLKKTAPRMRVLEIISNKKTAISQPELEKITGDSIDRVTLYRILSTFEEKGIVHRVFDLHGTSAYALCSHECTDEKHEDNHIHFICSQCNSVYCLDEMPTINIDTPKGFSLQSITINAVGICENCKNNSV